MILRPLKGEGSEEVQTTNTRKKDKEKMEKMATRRNIAEQPDGLKEIPMYAWIIHCYGRDYIYSGQPKGLKDAVRRVANEPHNRGSKATYKKIVG
jgi:hypothetical protein